MAGVFESIEETAARFESVTKDDIAAAAKKIKLDTVYFMAGSGEGEADCE